MIDAYEIVMFFLFAPIFVFIIWWDIFWALLNGRPNNLNEKMQMLGWQPMSFCDFDWLSGLWVFPVGLLIVYLWVKVLDLITENV